MAKVLVGIEFDQARFPNAVKAEQWVREKPEYDCLSKRQKWRLTSVARSKWMSKEPRKVFSWYSEHLWRFTTLEVTRPDPYVLVVWGLTAGFDESDIPALYPHTIQKATQAMLAQKLKDEKRIERTEESKEKKKRKKASKKPNGSIIDEPTEKPKKRRAPKKSKVDTEPIKVEDPNPFEGGSLEPSQADRLDAA